MRENTLQASNSAWIKLTGAGLPARRLTDLLLAFSGDPFALISAAPGRWREAAPGLTDKQIDRLSVSVRRDVASDLVLMRNLRASVVPFDDPLYPPRLREIADAPPVLFTRGQLHSEDILSLAVVGSRRASSYGMAIAEQFACELSRAGVCIVSGGARGIDTLAHKGALSGGGRTVAFIGCGLDVTYPAENRQLFDQMVDSGNGVIVSEYPFGTTPEPWRFPARNRLISGMSIGTLVIESPVDSGAIITATDAANQGREVFAVPGPINSGRSSGCHKLIQEGAKLVETPNDVLSELGVLQTRMSIPDAPRRFTSIAASRKLPPELLIPKVNRDTSGLEPDQQKVFALLTFDSKHVDQLVTESNMAANTVMGVLTFLELKGFARRVPGNSFFRVD